MIPDGLTLPAAEIGVWEGAAVIVRSSGHDYYQGRRGVVVGRHWEEWAVWLTPVGDLPGTMIAARPAGLHLDLRDRPTRLELEARLDEREPRWREMILEVLPTDRYASRDAAAEAYIRALAIVAGRVFGEPT